MTVESPESKVQGPESGESVESGESARVGSLSRAARGRLLAWAGVELSAHRCSRPVTSMCAAQPARANHGVGLSVGGSRMTCT